MKFFVNIVVVTLISLTLAAGAADMNLVTMKTVGAVPVELKSRILSWVSETIAPVTDAGIYFTEATNLASIATSLSTFRTNKNQVVLVLVNQCPQNDRPVFGINGVVAVNIEALKLYNMTTPEAKEAFSRRVDKEAVAGVATLLYMPPCPLLWCALYEHQTIEELDQKARSLCPPCIQKLHVMIDKFPDRNPPVTPIISPPNESLQVFEP